MNDPRTKIFNMIEAKTSFVICTHAHPDPDALASQLALGLYLEARGKRVCCISDDPVPEHFLFLPGSERIVCREEDIPSDYDVVIVTDCGDLRRIGKPASFCFDGYPVINIDHHVTNQGFGTVNCVVPDASSTAEVIFDLLRGEARAITEEIALLLYVGIMTDTGSFRYSNTSAHTHAITAELLRHDIAPNELYKKIYESVPLSELKYFTKLVSEFDALHEGRLICVELPKRIVNKFSPGFDLRDKIFGFLRSAQGVEILVIFTEDTASRTRVNFRSQGELDVAGIAYEFHGGGHSRASGCVLECDIKSARRKILRRMAKLFH